jgi:hypothetical protein
MAGCAATAGAACARRIMATRDINRRSDIGAVSCGVNMPCIRMSAIDEARYRQRFEQARASARI